MQAHYCEEMDRHLAAGEVALVHIPEFREYGIKILDGGSSFQLIGFCPWCGLKLPESLREQWFELLESLGLELGDPAIPKEMFNEEWWQKEDYDTQSHLLRIKRGGKGRFLMFPLPNHS